MPIRHQIMGDAIKPGRYWRAPILVGANVLVVREDDFDPMSEETVAAVREEERKKLKYDCAPCKPGYGETPPPCVSACEEGAISHTESWKEMVEHGNLPST